jgi:hypothetical protein
MLSEKSRGVADRAKAIYANRLRANLEAEHPNKYVAIEPDSGDFFLADSFAGAVRAARDAYPDRISFVIRIGHQAAIHLGEMTS